MASASRPLLRVRAPGRRTFSVRRIPLGALAGLAALASAAVAVAAVVVAVGPSMPLTFEPRSDLRSDVFSDASIWQPWTARPSVGMTAQRAIIANLTPPAARSSPVPDLPPSSAPVRAAAAEVRLAEPDITGSLGSRGPRLAFADPAPDVASKSVLPRLVLSPPPLPPPRPLRLAALTPPDVAMIKPEPDVRTPRTAIYDITAQTVYMPNGDRLEAHSGYGPFIDDPDNVHRKMRGSTPPNVYKLKLRERLFHGVQAIRMTPEDEGAMFGRDGILAHSYLLGPSGQSHGCVSFKDYPKFLNAFLRGEVDRMIVVARLDGSSNPVARVRKPPVSVVRLDRRPIVSARPENPGAINTF
jgi:hypothetical protein